MKWFALMVIAINLMACSTAPTTNPSSRPPLVENKGLQQDQVDLINQYADPLEGFNRRMYYFNAKLDRYVLLPLVAGYKAVTPDPVEKGVSNFFSNLGEVNTLVNALLQAKGKVALTTTGRFLVNSTVGLFGLLDPATEMGLYREEEDFGQTLGRWGVSPGPYLILPALGPSSLRDAGGIVLDMQLSQATLDELGLKSEEELGVNILDNIDTRAGVPFTYYATGSAFEYELIRFLYFRSREAQVQR